MANLSLQIGGSDRQGRGWGDPEGNAKFQLGVSENNGVIFFLPNSWIH